MEVRRRARHRDEATQNLASDGQVTRLDTFHLDPSTFTSRVYGADVFIQATSDDLQVGAPSGVGIYYTHIDLATARPFAR